MTKPTKGPYRLGSPTYLDAEIELWCAHIYDAGANLIGCGYGQTKEQAEANAKLLAAAWELREALQAISELTPESLGECFDEWGEAACWKKSYDIARAALAKADGKETKNEHAK